MNIVGIIAEYNPMHNGHIYHIEETRNLTHADYVIVIMSGSFTEQGNISVLNKFDRAKLAIQNGADLVIELPTIYSTSSSELFALGAISILNNLKIVTHIAFGAETNNIDLLINITNKLKSYSKQILDQTKLNLKTGLNAIASKDIAMKKILSPEEYAKVSLPNNLLGIKYLSALNEFKSTIQPVVIERLNSSHSDQELSNNCIFASSTAIRKLLSRNPNEKNNIKEISEFVPQNCYNLLNSDKLRNKEDLWPLLKFEILKLGVNGLEDISEMAEGLHIRIYNIALTCNSYSDFISSVKCKRYTLGRIKRIAIYILLGITKTVKHDLSNVSYARILKVKNEKKEILSMLSTSSSIPVISKITDDIVKLFPMDIRKSLELDILATNISATSKELLNTDYTNNIVS